MTKKVEHLDIPPEDINRRDRIVRDTTRMWFSSMFVQITSIVRGVIIPRILQPEFYGIIGGLTLIFKYGLYLDFGFLSAINREIPKLKAKEDFGKIETIESNTFTLSIITTGIYIIAILVYGLTVWGGFSTFIYISIFAFSFIPLRFSNFYRVIAESYRRFDIASNFNIFTGVTNLVIIVPLVVLFKFHGFLIALPVSLLINFLYLHLSKFRKFHLSLNIKTLKDLFTVGFPLFLMGLGGTFLLTIDRLMIIHLSSASALGIYMIAVTIATFIHLLINNSTRVLGPEIFNEWGKTEDKKRLLSMTKETLFPINTFIIIIIAGTVLSFPLLFNVLLPKYQGADIPCILLTTGIYFLGASVGFWLILIAINSQIKIFVFQLISIPVAIITMYILFIEGLGLIGVAIGTLTGILIYSFLLIFYTIAICDNKLINYIKIFLYILLPLIYFGLVTFGLKLLFKSPDLLDFKNFTPNLIVTLKRFVILITSSLPIFLILQWKTGIFTNIKKLFFRYRNNLKR
jgi:O-antigen/teichoic acid export membrane protein